MIERIDLIEHKLDYPTFKIKRLREWLNERDNWDEFDCVKEATKAHKDEERLLDNKALVDRCKEWNSSFSWKGEADDILVGKALEIYRLMKRKGLHESVLADFVEMDNIMAFAKREVKSWYKEKVGY